MSVNVSQSTSDSLHLHRIPSQSTKPLFPRSVLNYSDPIKDYTYRYSWCRGRQSTQGKPVEEISSSLSCLTAAGSLSSKCTFSFAILTVDLDSGCKVKY